MSEQQHSSQYQEETTTATPQEFNNLILIDVDEKRLVKTGTKPRYITLSYVYGAAYMLRRPESITYISSSTVLCFNSKIKYYLVILNAIELVVALGERYLQVDRLYILQDDPKQKYNQILQMDLAYYRGLLTIVSCCSQCQCEAT